MRQGGRGAGGQGRKRLFPSAPLSLCSSAILQFISILLVAILTGAKAQDTPESRKLKIVEADRLELRTENKEELVILTGSPVKILRGEEKIEAERVLYNKTRKTLKMLGNVYYLDKQGQEIRADELDLDTSDESFEALEVKLKSGEFDLIGPICQRAAGQILLEQGYFTSCLQCGHDVADYAFRAREVLLFPGDRIIAREVQVLVRDTPVLYLPVLLLFLTERRPKIDVGFNSDGPDGAFVIADLPFVSDFGIGFSLLRYWERRGWGFGLDLQGAGAAKQRTYFEFLPPLATDRAKNPPQTTGYLRYDFSYLLEGDEEWRIDAYIRRNDLPANEPGLPQVSEARLSDINFKIDYKLGEPIYKFSLDTFLDHDSTTPPPLSRTQKKPELEASFPQGYKDGGFSITGRAVLGLYQASKNPFNSKVQALDKNTWIQAGRLLVEHIEGYSFNSSTVGAVKVPLPQGSQLNPLPKFADSPVYTPTAGDKILINGFFDERSIEPGGVPGRGPTPDVRDPGAPTDPDDKAPNTPKPPQITLTLLNGTLTLPVATNLPVEIERLEVDFGKGGDFKIGELTLLPGSQFVPPPGSADTLPEGSITVPPGSTLALPEGSKLALSYTLSTLPLKEGSVLEIPAGSVFTSLANPTPQTLGKPIKLNVPSGSSIRPGEGTPPTQTGQAQPSQRDPAQPTQPGQAQPNQPGQAQPTQPGQAQPNQPGQATPTPKREAQVTFSYTPEPGATLKLPDGANLTIPPIPPRPAWEGFTLRIDNRFTGYYYTFQSQRQINWSTVVNANQVLGPFTIGLNFNRNITEGESPFSFEALGTRRTLFVDLSANFKPDPLFTLAANGGYEFNYGRTPGQTRWRTKPLQFSATLQPDASFSITAGLTRNVEEGRWEPLRLGINFSPNPFSLQANYERDIQVGVPVKSDLRLGLNPLPFSLSFNTNYVWNELQADQTYKGLYRFGVTNLNLGYNPTGSTISLNHLRDLNNGQAISTQLQINLRDETDNFSFSQTLSQPYFGTLAGRSERFRFSGNAFVGLGPHSISASDDIAFPEGAQPRDGRARFSFNYAYNQPGNTTSANLNWEWNFIERCFLQGQRPVFSLSSRLVDLDTILDISASYRFGGCEIINNAQIDQPDYLERIGFIGAVTVFPSPRTLEDGLGLAVQGKFSVERRAQDGRFEIRMEDFGPTFSILAPENTRIYFSTFFNAPINNVSFILPAFFNENFILKPKFILAIDRCCWATRLVWDLVKGEFKWTVLLGGQAADFIWNDKGFQFPGPTQP